MRVSGNDHLTVDVCACFPTLKHGEGHDTGTAWNLPISAFDDSKIGAAKDVPSFVGYTLQSEIWNDSKIGAGEDVPILRTTPKLVSKNLSKVTGAL